MDLPPTRTPGGPEDPGPKPIVTMTTHQAREFRRLTAEHGTSVGVRDEGDGWVAVVLYGVDNEVLDDVALPPI